MNKQNSLLALGLLCQEYHENWSKEFVAAFPIVIGKHALQHDDLEVQVSSLACLTTMIHNLGPRIIDRNFEPGFFVEHFIKDMGIALEESKRMGLSMPGLALANQLYLSVQANGLGKKGTHALMLALEQMSNVKR